MRDHFSYHDYILDLKRLELYTLDFVPPIRYRQLEPFRLSLSLRCLPSRILLGRLRQSLS
jgi:hypothetical protein